MDYIINPIWIYAFNTLHAFSIAILIASIIFLVFIFAFALYAIIEKFIDEDDATDYKKVIQFFKKYKKYIVIAIIGILFYILIPSRETMIEMLVAKAATKQNIALTVENVKSIIDYIVTAIKG